MAAFASNCVAFLANFTVFVCRQDRKLTRCVQCVVMINHPTYETLRNISLGRSSDESFVEQVFLFNALIRGRIVFLRIKNVCLRNEVNLFSISLCAILLALLPSSLFFHIHFWRTNKCIKFMALIKTVSRWIISLLGLRFFFFCRWILIEQINEAQEESLKAKLP